jgi:subtilisin family serine protease
MNQMNLPKRSLVAAAIAAAGVSLLSGCASGGGSGPASTYAPLPPVQTAPVRPTNTARVTITKDYNGAPAQSVNVAVLDSGINPTHQEFTDNNGKNGVGGNIITGGITSSSLLYTKYSSLYGALPSGLNPNDYNWDNGNVHGNYVASIIGGANIGYSGNASLYIEKITDTTTADPTVIAAALGDAASKGMSFSNLSYDMDPITTYQIAANTVAKEGAGSGVTVFNNAEDVQYNEYRTVINKGMGVVISAGNSNLNVSTDANWQSGNPVIPLTLIVGSSDSTGNYLAPYSNYAGDNPLIQSRFLVAPGTNTGADPASNTSYGSFTGTSSAAPVVTAAAATLKSYWSFMTPTQVEQRLLDTTDKNFNALWSQNTCGTSGTLNCGTYYFGQGRLNLSAALAPAGVVVTSVGTAVPTSVTAQSAPIQATSLTVPASMASIQKQVQAASVGVQGFDAIGRNYTINLAPQVGASIDPAQALGNKIGGVMTTFMSNGSSRFTSFDQQ